MKMNSKKILLADDEALVANVAKAMLLHLGYEVIIAGNGKEAIDLFHQYRDELSMIILDYNMPEMDGLDCLSMIRESSSIPAIISTGAGINFPMDEIAEHQAQGILSKPFTMEEMRLKIAEFIE